MKTVLRTERKFLLNEIEVANIRDKLMYVMRQDVNSGENGYQVRSLYFDSWNDADYFAKANSEEKRKKIRVRIYNPEDDYAFLEMKQKDGMLQHKRSLKITKEDAIAMTKGNYGCLLNYKESFAMECYGLMQTNLYRPKTIVEYKRIPYVVDQNNIRITLDSQIVSTESSMDLFSSQLNMNPVMNLDLTVLEVKYNAFLLSYVQDVLNKVDKSELSVSKYVLARQNSFLTSL